VAEILIETGLVRSSPSMIASSTCHAAPAAEISCATEDVTHGHQTTEPCEDVRGNDDGADLRTPDPNHNVSMEPEESLSERNQRCTCIACTCANVSCLPQQQEEDRQTVDLREFGLKLKVLLMWRYNMREKIIMKVSRVSIRFHCWHWKRKMLMLNCLWRLKLHLCRLANARRSWQRDCHIYRCVSRTGAHIWNP